MPPFRPRPLRVAVQRTWDPSPSPASFPLLFHPIALPCILSVEMRNDLVRPSSSYRTSQGPSKGHGKGSNNPSGTKPQPHKARSAISAGLSVHPLPTQRALAPPESFGRPPSNIPACSHWKADPASQGISPTSYPSNILLSCQLKAVTNSREATMGHGTSCPGWRQAGRLLQPLWGPPAPSAIPAGHTAAREMTKQHLSCLILQVCPSKWDRSFCRVSCSCSEFVRLLQDWWVQARPGSHAVPCQGSHAAGTLAPPSHTAARSRLRQPWTA